MRCVGDSGSLIAHKTGYSELNTASVILRKHLSTYLLTPADLHYVSSYGH